MYQFVTKKAYKTEQVSPEWWFNRIQELLSVEYEQTLELTLEVAEKLQSNDEIDKAILELAKKLHEANPSAVAITLA